MSLYAAIVDYGLGNLYSVKQACNRVGLDSVISSDRHLIENASAVILPGVGAFGDAMENLKRFDLVGVLKDYAFSGRPMMGICLGLQLLMEESEEFGVHRGLAIIKGNVVKIKGARANGRMLKVPQVGWNAINAPAGVAGSNSCLWEGSPLDGVTGGTFMYFVHSFTVQPVDEDVRLAETVYGGISFCSAIRYKGLFACQFHPEKSGACGLEIYKSFQKKTIKSRKEQSHE